MTTVRHVREVPNRITWRVSYCPKTYQAMKTLQNRLKDSSGTEYSLAVIARALGLLAARDADTSPHSELLELCRYCGSQTRKNVTTKGDQSR